MKQGIKKLAAVGIILGVPTLTGILGYFAAKDPDYEIQTKQATKVENGVVVRKDVKFIVGKKYGKSLRITEGLIDFYAGDSTHHGYGTAEVKKIELEESTQAISYKKKLWTDTARDNIKGHIENLVEGD